MFSMYNDMDILYAGQILFIKKEGEIISEVPSFGCRLRRVKFI